MSVYHYCRIGRSGEKWKSMLVASFCADGISDAAYIVIGQMYQSSSRSAFFLRDHNGRRYSITELRQIRTAQAARCAG